MLKSILVGLDGSEHCDGAIELGTRLAKRHGALLAGIGVIDEPTICAAEPVPLGGDAFKEHRDKVLLARAELKVDELLNQFALECTAAGVSSRNLKSVGLPWKQIVLEGQRFDLILIGQQTFFHFETQDEECDTLKKVVKNTPRPVLTAPEKPVDGSATIIAYDGSLQATRALQSWQDLGLAEGEETHVVSIASDTADAARHAERAVDYLRLHDVRAEVHALATSAAPAGVILDMVRQLQAGMIVLGAYGKPFLSEFFFGSVTRTLLEKSPVPLFLYH